MKLARIAATAGSGWGVVIDDLVHPLVTAPWDGLRRTGEVLPLAEVRLLPPTIASKIVCIGKNYRDHIAEMGYERPAVPSVFLKPPTAIIGSGGAVIMPPRTLSNHVEHEAELGIVIGRAGRSITEDAALDHVLGFTCADDVSARDLQRSDPYPTRAKGLDTFCPIGPWIATDVDVSAGLRIQCRVNGETRQDGSTLDMIYDVPFIISFVSQFTTLVPGDLILTGSPGGSGPLMAGDEVEIEIEGIGVLRHSVSGHRPHDQEPDDARQRDASSDSCQ